MITEEFWRSWLVLCFLVGPFLLGIVSTGYSVYLNQRYWGEITEALKNSRYIYIWGPSLRNRGWIWSSLVIAKIAQMIIWPTSSLRIGELDPTDLKNFPPKLKRLLKIDSMMMIGSAIWLAVVIALVQFK